MTKNIAISDETYERLKKYGEFGDTFDDLICKIMNKLDDCESVMTSSRGGM